MVLGINFKDMTGFGGKHRKGGHFRSEPHPLCLSLVLVHFPCRKYRVFSIVFTEPFSTLKRLKPYNCLEHIFSSDKSAIFNVHYNRLGGMVFMKPVALGE